jgi:transposase
MESLSSSAVVVAVSEGVQRKKRQQRSVAEKRRIVEATMAPGASVALVARAHGVNANQLFGWRRVYRAGRLTATRWKAISPNVARLLPVEVSG